MIMQINDIKPIEMLIKLMFRMNCVWGLCFTVVVSS